MVNEYGSLLDMHQDDLRSQIWQTEDEIRLIKDDIKKLLKRKEKLEELIPVLKHNHKLYIEMIELIGLDKDELAKRGNSGTT